MSAEKKTERGQLGVGWRPRPPEPGPLTGAGTGDDGEAQGVSGSTEDLGQLPVGQGHHGAALHRLQPVSGSDLTALGRWASPADRDEAVGQEGNSCRGTKKKRASRKKNRLKVVGDVAQSKKVKP